MPDAMQQAQEDLNFLEEVSTAFHEAGAKRQVITHQTHRFSPEEQELLNRLETLMVGRRAYRNRLQLLGR
jgi:hypothetical protein